MYITCAAIWFNDDKQYIHQPYNIETGFVICGHRHYNCFMTASMLKDCFKTEKMQSIQGFMTNENTFVDRKEAGLIAFNAKQTTELKNILFSEDLY